MAQILVNAALPRFKEFQFEGGVDLFIPDGKNFAIIGPNGAGKTLLTDTMLGNIALKSGSASITKKGVAVPRNKVAFMSFRDIYTMCDTTNTYYQQRWNSTENEETPFVHEVLKIDKYDNGKELIAMLDAQEVLNKRILFLSSGELRKIQIIKALLAKPDLLVIKNPYIGLDSDSRLSVNELLEKICKSFDTQIGLLLSNVDDIPDFIHLAIPVLNRHLLNTMAVTTKEQKVELRKKLFAEGDEESLSSVSLPSSDIRADYETAIVMNNVNVKYPAKHILRDVSWTVRRGEKWALLGKNGCGKSTLLSLVCGDNPQGYANDIVLFDHKRGSGESIWDIKKHIGYLSPDMHTYYRKDIPCKNVVASGFFNSIGLYNTPNDEQKSIALEWMKVFHAEHLSDRSFLTISYGEQRLILLIRVFVKNPSLVILDEPLHGLDEAKKRLAKHIIEEYCSRDNVTLIYVTHYENEIPQIVDKRKVLSSNSK